MVDQQPAAAGADQAIALAFDFALSESGFDRSGLSWTWTSGQTFIAFTALPAEGEGGLAYSMRFGWRYEAFGDPPPDPGTAHGCVRSMTLDELGGLTGKPMGVLGRADEQSISEFEQRLATVVRKQVLRWIEIWKRPEGYRDFLADKQYHLAAAWASALLRHDERARLELAHAAHLYGGPLDDAFDRMRADGDASVAAVFAATNGLPALLAAADEETVAAFTSERGATARSKVLEPQSEHRRMQRRHELFAAACIRYLDS